MTYNKTTGKKKKYSKEMQNVEDLKWIYINHLKVCNWPQHIFQT